jgi:hypothetical protein
VLVETGRKESAMAKGKAAIVKRAGVDPSVAMLLGKIMTGKQELSFRKGEKIFSQGDFVQTGRIDHGRLRHR